MLFIFYVHYIRYKIVQEYMSIFKKMGPGVLVAAAFIGPGTVAICILAGSQYQFAILWALVISIIATIFLQEMTARLGIVTQKGLAKNLREQLQNPIIKTVVIAVVLLAIVIGNATYEAGNIAGASLGLEAIFGTEYLSFYPVFIGAAAALILGLDNYILIERVLVFLVIIMSLSFCATAIYTQPDILSLLKGMLVPQIPEGSIFLIVALVGTTVVPYNLFLHASLVTEKWSSSSDLKFAKRDTIVAIALGGLVSLSIVVVAASLNDGVNGVLDIAKSLEPLYGDFAKYLIGIGLLAAGITSAITAPLAAAYVVKNCLGWEEGISSNKFKAVWIIIIAIGIGSSLLKIKPLELIQLAQIANGILLPIIAIFLLWIVNRNSVMGTYKNTMKQNIIGIAIILFAIFLGAKSIIKVFM